MTPEQIAPPDITESRKRMMRRTVSASRQRDLLEDALEALLSAIANDYVSEEVQAAARYAAEARVRSAEIGEIFAGCRPIIVPQW